MNDYIAIQDALEGAVVGRMVHTDIATPFVAALANAGLVIVPKEPTQAMANAAVDETDMGLGMSWHNRSPQMVARDCYRAMIAAAKEGGDLAPTPPTDTGG